MTVEEAKEFAAEQERIVLSLFLIYYRFFSSSKNSFWTPYIDVLPSFEFFKNSHVLFNTSSVRGTCLENPVEAKWNSLKREQEEIESIEQDSWLQKIELSMYIWANCVFWSRAVGVGESSGGSGMALVPFFDLANHSFVDPNIRWEITDNGGLALLTTKEVKEKNQELSLFYGSKSNQELLFIHGFCVEGNPEPSRITLPIIGFFDFQSEEDVYKIQWLKSVGGHPTLTMIRKEDLVSTEDKLLSSGWTMGSLAALYLICLLYEDDLSFKEAPEDHELPMLLVLNKKPIQDLNDLYFTVRQLKIFPIIQLRASILLTQALEYQLHQNTENCSPTVPKPLEIHVSLYRAEEYMAIQIALTETNALQKQLSINEDVQSYLEHQKEQ
ncbi:hypothetical protein BY458DRAFT_471914 [Sporodiniella umbellata]|nr:hypothetical protein BY458DRAFT_471914 [Sporodiniella umbellata]